MKKIEIKKLKANPKNPRSINKTKFEKLKKSITDFPKMLELRPIVVDEDFVVLGGNMRLKALKDLGIKETYYIQEKGLTPEQKEQFIIKDNASFGDWDWDILANEWENAELKEWGVDVWQPEEVVDYSVLDELDIGNALGDKEAGVKRAIQIEFEPEHYDEASELITAARKAGKIVGLIVLNAFRNET
jgi:hypothetical protein